MPVINYIDRLTVWDNSKKLEGKYIGLSFKDSRSFFQICKDAKKGSVITEIFNHIGEENGYFNKLIKQRACLDKNYKQREEAEKKNILQKIEELRSKFSNYQSKIENIKTIVNSIGEIPIFKCISSGLTKAYEKSEIFPLLNSDISQKIARDSFVSCTGDILGRILGKVKPIKLVECKKEAVTTTVVSAFLKATKFDKFLRSIIKCTSFIQVGIAIANAIFEIIGLDGSEIVNAIVKGVSYVATGFEIASTIAQGVTAVTNIASAVSFGGLVGTAIMVVVAFGVKLAFTLYDGMNYKQNFLKFLDQLIVNLKKFVSTIYTKHFSWFGVLPSEVKDATDNLIDLANGWCRIYTVKGDPMGIKFSGSSQGKIVDVSRALYSLGMGLIYAEHTRIIQPSKGVDEIALTHGQTKGALRLIKEAENALEENDSLKKYLQQEKNDLKRKELKARVEESRFQNGTKVNWTYNFDMIWNGLKQITGAKTQSLLFYYVTVVSIKLSPYSFILDYEGVKNKSVNRLSKYITGNCRKFAKHGRILEYALLQFKLINKKDAQTQKTDKTIQKIFGTKIKMDKQKKQQYYSYTNITELYNSFVGIQKIKVPVIPKNLDKEAKEFIEEDKKNNWAAFNKLKNVCSALNQKVANLDKNVGNTNNIIKTVQDKSKHLSEEELQQAIKEAPNIFAAINIVNQGLENLTNNPKSKSQYHRSNFHANLYPNNNYNNYNNNSNNNNYY